MATVTRSPKPVKPVSGSCRWVGPPMVVGYRPGRLAITKGEVVTVYTVFSLHSRDGRLVGFRMAKANGECWDIDADLWQCCCPDYLYRAARRVGCGQAADCKHVRALKAALPKCPVLI